MPAGLLLSYNLTMAGHWAGGYGLAGGRDHFDQDLVLGLAGLLFSPTHGLLVFSPFLLLVPLAFRRVCADAGHRRLTVALGIGMALQLLFYSKLDWSGGASWGPRWLTDLLPVLFWMLPPAVVPLKTAGRLAFACGCAVAIAIETIGAFWYLNASDEAVAERAEPRARAVGRPQRAVRRRAAARARPAGPVGGRAALRRRGRPGEPRPAGRPSRGSRRA